MTISPLAKKLEEVERDFDKLFPDSLQPTFWGLRYFISDVWVPEVREKIELEVKEFIKGVYLLGKQEGSQEVGLEIDSKIDKLKLEYGDSAIDDVLTDLQTELKKKII